MVALRKAGHSVYVVYPNEGAFSAKAIGIANGTKHIYNDHWTGYGQLSTWQKLKFVRGFLRAGRAIAAYAEEIGADVVVTNTSTIPAGAIGAKMAGLPHVWYIHEFVVEDHKLRWQYGQRFSYWVINRLSAAVVVNSKAVLAKLKRYISEEKLQLVYCACDTPSAPNVLPSHISPVAQCLMVGSVSPGKNQLEAIQALGILTTKGMALPLHLVGHCDAAYKVELESEARKRDVKVVFSPFEADLKKIFSDDSLFLLCSSSEAFGRVVVEAQKFGLPVVVSGGGGVREIVDDGENGLVYEPGDAAALSDKIGQLVIDSSLRNGLARGGFASANERFNLKTHIDAFTLALEKALKK